MSFLNPVNEPVLRFKSTDAGAPQINYNSRVAGDVKAVLKACLVTGYGAIASAGWTAANEVSHVIEFVSPSAAMIDYRIGIDDTSVSSTAWYYQYQDAKITPPYNTPTKSFGGADKAHANNGWQLFVTERGLLFVELIQHSSVGRLSARITYMGQCKSALIDTNNKNMMFICVGHNQASGYPHSFYASSTHITTGSYTSGYMNTATAKILEIRESTMDMSAVDVVSPIYVSNDNQRVLVGELPPMLSKLVNATSDCYGISELDVGGRNVLSVCAGTSEINVNYIYSWARTFLIRTDYWEY